MLHFLGLGFSTRPLAARFWPKIHVFWLISGSKKTKKIENFPQNDAFGPPGTFKKKQKVSQWCSISLLMNVALALKKPQIYI